MKPYSIDLRENILRAYDQGLGSQRALAALFGISHAFMEQWLQRRRATGELPPRPHAGGRRPSCEAAALALVGQWVHENPDATLAELGLRLRQQCGRRVSVSTMSRVLTRVGLPRQTSHSMPASGTPSGPSQCAPAPGSESPRSTNEG
jgi:transposase